VPVSSSIESDAFMKSGSNMLHAEVNYLLRLSCMSNMYKLVMKTLIFSHSNVDRSMHW